MSDIYEAIVEQLKFYNIKIGKQKEHELIGFILKLIASGDVYQVTTGFGATKTQNDFNSPMPDLNIKLEEKYLFCYEPFRKANLIQAQLTAEIERRNGAEKALGFYLRRCGFLYAEDKTPEQVKNNYAGFIAQLHFQKYEDKDAR